MNWTKSAAIAGFVAILSVSTARAQVTGGSASAGTVDRSRGPEGTTDIGKFQNWSDLMAHARSGNFLAGRVQIKGAELPWENIAVHVTCNGKEKTTTLADAKGNFILQAAQSKVANSDSVASSSKAVSSSEFAGCQVHAALPGFDSSTLTIRNHDVMDQPDIGIVMLEREAGATGSALSTTSAGAPKDATKSFDKARKAWFEGNADAVVKELQKATQSYPQYAEAWYQLGKMQQQQGKAQEAWDSFSKAIAADPKFALPYDHLAILAAQQSKWEDLQKFTDTGLQLNPGASAQTWYLNALGNFKMGKKDVALQSANKALAMDPLHNVPNTEQLLAVMLADKHDFAGALEHLRNLLTYMKPGPDAEVVKTQVAQLEKMVPQQKPQ